MSEELRAAGPCRDCGQHTNAGLVIAEIHQGNAAGGAVVQCRACEENPWLAAENLRKRMREVRRYPE